MSTPAIPLEEFNQERASTRRLLERVPGEFDENVEAAGKRSQRWSATTSRSRGR